jgi:hypothetical protein
VALGAIGAYYRSSYGWGYGDVHYNYATIASRGDFHFSKFIPAPKLDLHAGLLRGYSIVWVSGPSAGTGSSRR